MRFLGTGSEYFRIWIVNLLLTIVTLGIYSAWAKVRRLKYMYRNTQIAGSSFDYHGSPVAILKGRLIALVLLIAYNYSFQLSVTAGLITLAILAAIFPWLIRQSLRFRLRYSSYRGIRFRFAGRPGELYLIAAPLLLLVLPAVLTAGYAGEEAEPPVWLTAVIGATFLAYGAIVPYLHYRFKRYQHGNSFFGATRARFTATAGGFYAVYGVVLLIPLSVGILAAVTAPALGSYWRSEGSVPYVGIALGLIIFYVLYLLMVSAFVVLLQNRIWNNTALGDVSFRSRARVLPMTRIYFVNIILLVVTLGLFTPFAVIRSLRYRLESVSVVNAAGMDHFISDVAGEDVDAAGEGAADLFDIDIGL
ncbi:MAG: DUF898 domain-containing protein [Burkholderiaceae bacterium]|nr:DUF898 domain-containing protein [Burkholderiaceae bacterium]